MSIPNLIGPVQSGSSFMFASVQNGKPFVLNAAPYQSGFVYYWEGNINTIANTNNLMPIFITHSKTLDGLSIVDQTNQGGIGFRADNVTIGFAQLPDPTLKMAQTAYANWFPPDLFLSKAIYTIYNSKGATGQVLTAVPDSSGNAPTIPATNIIILPTNWFADCTGDKYNYINDAHQSAVNWMCDVTPIGALCTSGSLLKSGWTNLMDCQVGNSYSYCPTGDLCGTNTCKGPCKVIYDDCTYRSGNNEYVCVFDPVKYVTDTKWWTTPYFIGAVVGFVVLTIVCIIVIIVLARRNRRLAAESESSDDNN